MIPAHEMHPLETIFVHLEDDGTPYTFAVERMLRDRPGLSEANQIETCIVPVSVEFAKVCRKSKGVEEPRLAAISLSKPVTPILVASWPDGTSLIVDGHHRYVRYAEARRYRIRAYMFPEAVWRNYLVDGHHATREALARFGATK